MRTDILGHDAEDCGIEIYDDEGERHVISVSWNGEIIQHATKGYPNDPADRTDEQQRIMSRVEARALYAAHREFPDAGLVDPQWDPDHLQRGIEALSNYPLEEFNRQFRDFYEVVRDPLAHIPHDDAVLDHTRVHKPFTITADNRIDTVYDVFVVYERETGDVTSYGEPSGADQDRVITLGLPKHDFDDPFEYDSGFAEIALQHLIAQVRDIYYHMGEEPPDEYKVQGWGKFEFYGDGVTEWENVTGDDGEPVKPELCDA